VQDQVVDFKVAVAAPADVSAAVEVWRAANTARGLPPTVQRVQRVVEKLQAVDASVVLGRTGLRVTAVALAEPGRADDGSGEGVPGCGHVSMVFVHPDLWGQGLGSTLMAGLHANTDRLGWVRTSLWTRESNARALRLYLKCGYRPTGRAAALRAGDPIVQLERCWRLPDEPSR